MGRFSSSEAREDREVEEAEARGDSTGEPIAVDGWDASESVVMFRRRAGFCRGAVAVEPAMVRTTMGLCQGDGLLWSFLETPARSVPRMSQGMFSWEEERNLNVKGAGVGRYK